MKEHLRNSSDKSISLAAMHDWRFGTWHDMNGCIEIIHHCSSAFLVLLRVTDVSCAHRFAPGRGEMILGVSQNQCAYAKADFTSIRSQSIISGLRERMNHFHISHLEIFTPFPFTQTL